MCMYVGYTCTDVPVERCMVATEEQSGGYRERKEHWDSSNTLMYMVLCTVCLSVCTCCVVTVV